jgi:hypothetical protein
MKYTFALTILFCLFYTSTIFSQEEIDPKETEVWEPVPKAVTPGLNDAPPSDAIILFDGISLSEWESSKGGEAPWEVRDGYLTVVPKSGSIKTKKAFGDCQLHIEWRSPEKIEGEGQGRGNSGVFLMEQYEVQVLDSYNNRTYSNGQAGSLYKQHIPLVNACRKPGQWQEYDIIFTAPVFGHDGNLKSPAYVTVIHNGVLIQNHVELKGITVFRGEPYYKSHPEKLPLSLQDHNNPVSYRNIWIREL